jgi:ABC-type long-subunit fatty acid transport system fused permease/ATPase subunit
MGASSRNDDPLGSLHMQGVVRGYVRGTMELIALVAVVVGLVTHNWSVAIAVAIAGGLVVLAIVLTLVLVRLRRQTQSTQ